MTRDPDNRIRARPGNRGPAGVEEIAANCNIILSAAAAHKKHLAGEIAELANTLHAEHGESQAETMDLGRKFGVIPIDTAAVDEVRVKGAGELAALVPLDGPEFEGAFVDAMVEGAYRRTGR